MGRAHMPPRYDDQRPWNAGKLVGAKKAFKLTYPEDDGRTDKSQQRARKQGTSERRKPRISPPGEPVSGQTAIGLRSKSMEKDGNSANWPA